MAARHIVAVNGSPREGETHNLLEQIAQALAPHHVQVTIVSLKDYEIGDCTGCEACIRKTGQCVQRDDAQAVLSQVLQADGIILASPVYVMNVTGKLKSLIDKTASWVHRPPLVGKPALLAATTAGAGLKETLGYMQEVAIQWGAHPAGRIGRTVTDARPVSAREIKRFAWHLEADPGQYAPSLRQLTWYQVQKVLALKISRLDRAYWTERGWDKRLYYYPCRISPAKRLFAWGLYQILYRRVQPVGTF